MNNPVNRSAELVADHLSHLCGRNWCIRETVFDPFRARWDIATCLPLGPLDKEMIDLILYNNVPASYRIDLTYSRAKMMTRLIFTVKQ